MSTERLQRKLEFITGSFTKEKSSFNFTGVGAIWRVTVFGHSYQVSADMFGTH